MIVVIVCSEEREKTVLSHGRNECNKSLQIGVRGLIVGDVVPVDQRSRVLPVIFFDTITPMRTYNSNPIHLRNCGSTEGCVRLSINLPLQRRNASFSVLAILDFNVALRRNDITLGSREQRGQD